MRAPLVVLLVSSAAAWFAFSLLRGGHGGGAPHWASAPILAASILSAMGSLVLATTLGRPRGGVARFK